MIAPPCVWLLKGCTPADPESPAESGEVTFCTHLNTLDEDTRDVVIGAAIAYLWNVTGRKYGTCPTSVRPCEDDCNGSRRYPYWGWTGVSGLGWVGSYSFLRPIIWNGDWINLACGFCADRCECGQGVSSLRLPGPVAEILEVRVDGAVLPETDYRLDNTGLVRLGGERWPKCQDMSADPMTDPDTFMVTYLRGRSAPPGGQLAAGTLACELAKMICGDKGCKLPKRVTSISREGVTIDLLDSFSTMWDKGSTGLLVVDMWLASERIGQRGSTQIASPGLRPYRNGPRS